MASETLNLALICVLYIINGERTNILIVKKLQMQMGWKMWWEIYRFFFQEAPNNTNITHLHSTFFFKYLSSVEVCQESNQNLKNSFEFEIIACEN